MTDRAQAIAERDRILIAMDIEAAKAFIVTHGGRVPAGRIDWQRVLHLARFEVTSMPEDVWRESHMWLARNGAQFMMTLPPTSPYLVAAMDLIFPKDLIAAAIAAAIAASQAEKRW